tara:strand:- start:332 stop:529 length:198 start_codon:yes stop_codon:yes gene_type:complete
MIEELKARLKNKSDHALLDQIVGEYGEENIKVATGIISLDTCEWIAYVVANRKKVVAKMAVSFRG